MEVRMAGFGEMNVGGFLEQLGAKTPAPGGGAAACMAGATAAALAQMVVAYSLGKKNLAEHEVHLQQASVMLSRARGLMLQLADEDAAAYALVNALQKLPEGDARREAELPAAAEAAVAVPRAALALCLDMLRLVESLCGKSNKFLRSDLAIAAVLAEAAARSAWWNVSVNLSLLGDEGERSRIAAEGERACARAGEIRAAVEGACG
jgi:formiminotetrahydrofolate cyclodeaminase